MRDQMLTVIDRLQRNVSAIVQRNQEVVASLFDVVITLGSQGLAFRGKHKNQEARYDSLSLVLKIEVVMRFLENTFVIMLRMFHTYLQVYRMR